MPTVGFRTESQGMRSQGAEVWTTAGRIRWWDAPRCTPSRAAVMAGDYLEAVSDAHVLQAALGMRAVRVCKHPAVHPSPQRPKR